MRAIIALAGLASGVAFCLQPPSVALARRYIAPPSAAGVRQLRSERRRSERPAVHMDASLPGPAAGRRRLVAAALGTFLLGGAILTMRHLPPGAPWAPVGDGNVPLDYKRLLLFSIQKKLLLFIE